MVLKRANRNSAKNFQELKYVYDCRHATCGLEEGKVDWITGKRVKIQQGHMDPRKSLTIDNTIPQCEYCNQTYQDYFRFDENGRVQNRSFLLFREKVRLKSAFLVKQKNTKTMKTLIQLVAGKPHNLDSTVFLFIFVLRCVLQNC